MNEHHWLHTEELPEGDESTPFEPGSEAKIAEMRRRCENMQSLYHEGDCKHMTENPKSYSTKGNESIHAKQPVGQRRHSGLLDRCLRDAEQENHGAPSRGKRL